MVNANSCLEYINIQYILNILANVDKLKECEHF